MKILLLCCVVFVCVQRSLQCGCPYEYTQQIVCDSEIGEYSFTVHWRVAEFTSKRT
jgi:hypothetical protein